MLTRIEQLHEEKEQAARKITELERQFVCDDLQAMSGPRRGAKLTAAGRRGRLRKLMRLCVAQTQRADEASRLLGQLTQMQLAIEDWADARFGGTTPSDR